MEINYQATDTMADFHASDAFVRMIRGPIGSGKSTGCCWEVFNKASNQLVHNGVRKSRWGVVRNTYGELKSTTIATWNDWFGDFTRITYGHPITGEFRMVLDDGTLMDCELFFLALDLAKDVRKLKSLEFTGIWFNEVSEILFDHVSMGTGRVNRFPAPRKGGFSWSGIIADTNSCEKSNWYYSMDMQEHPAWQDAEKNGRWDFFTQPGGLLNLGDAENPKFEDNPDAENIENHQLGFDYYYRLLPGKTYEWVSVYVLNEYGNPSATNKVYSNYNEANHTDVEFNPGRAINWTHDFNFVPLCSAILQEDTVGNIYAVDEIVIHGAEAKDCAAEFIDKFKGHEKCPVYIYGDADGHKGSKHGLESNYMIIKKLLNKAGFKVYMKVPRENGPIKDGQNALRAKIKDATGKRSFFVNPSKCPVVDLLGSVELKKGSSFQEDRDEQGGQDMGTAIRYFVNAKYPMVKVTTTTQRLGL